MESDAVDPGSLDRREPDPVTPVGVIEGRPVVGGENEAVGFHRREPLGGVMGGQEIHQPGREGQGPQPGP